MRINFIALYEHKNSQILAYASTTEPDIGSDILPFDKI